MRAFVAAYPSAEAIEHLDAFIEARREAGQFRWTPTDQWHLTLAFFAEVADHALDALIEGLERATARQSAMTATIVGGGAFPHVGRAKVLWAGIDVADAAALAKLAQGCRTAGATVGVAPGGDRFRPHLTLARINPPIQATKWVRLLDAYRGPAWQLDHVVLVESHLGEGPKRRPRHDSLVTFRL